MLPLAQKQFLMINPTDIILSFGDIYLPNTRTIYLIVEETKGAPIIIIIALEGRKPTNILYLSNYLLFHSIHKPTPLTYKHIPTTTLANTLFSNNEFNQPSILYLFIFPTCIHPPPIHPLLPGWRAVVPC